MSAPATVAEDAVMATTVGCEASADWTGPLSDVGSGTATEDTWSTPLAVNALVVIWAVLTPNGSAAG